jgi:hypothetical protein
MQNGLRMLTSDRSEGPATGHIGALRAGCTTAQMHRESEVTGDDRCARDCIRTWGGGKLGRAAGRTPNDKRGEIRRSNLHFSRHVTHLRNAALASPPCPPPSPSQWHARDHYWTGAPPLNRSLRLSRLDYLRMRAHLVDHIGPARAVRVSVLSLKPLYWVRDGRGG